MRPVERLLGARVADKLHTRLHGQQRDGPVARRSADAGSTTPSARRADVEQEGRGARPERSDARCSKSEVKVVIGSCRDHVSLAG